MKKFNFSLLLAILLLAGTQSFAQLAVDKGTKFVNAGIGVGGGYGYGGLGGYYGGYNRGILVGAAFEVGVYKNITVGGFADFRRIGFDIPTVGNYGVNYIYIGARGAYHFNELLSIPEKFDVYAGLGLMYLNANYDDTYFSGYGGGSGIYVPIFIGGRYFFTDKVGAFAEVGSTSAPLKLGVTFKL